MMMSLLKVCAFEWMLNESILLKRRSWTEIPENCRMIVRSFALVWVCSSWGGGAACFGAEANCWAVVIRVIEFWILSNNLKGGGSEKTMTSGLTNCEVGLWHINMISWRRAEFALLRFYLEVGVNLGIRAVSGEWSLWHRSEFIYPAGWKGLKR